MFNALSAIVAEGSIDFKSVAKDKIAVDRIL